MHIRSRFIEQQQPHFTLLGFENVDTYMVESSSPQINIDGLAV